MDGAHPAESGPVPNPSFPKIGKGRPVGLVKGSIVFHHHHIRIRRQGLLQLQESGPLRLLQDIIGIHPHTVVHGGFGKGMVPGVRKVILPRV